MSINPIRRAFRTTKVKANSFPPEAQAEIENLFIAVEAAKTDAVKAERAAGRAVNAATIARSRAQSQQLELLEHASSFSNQIAGERVWIIYRDKEGVITFEGITERLMRNNFRAEQEMIGRQLSENADDSGQDADLYEEDGGEEGTQGQ